MTYREMQIAMKDMQEHILHQSLELLGAPHRDVPVELTKPVSLYCEFVAVANAKYIMY